MNYRLTYPSGQQFAESLHHFETNVARRKSRVKVSFQQKDSRTYGSFSLPIDEAKRLAYAILTAASGHTDTGQPIQFVIDERTKES